MNQQANRNHSLDAFRVIANWVIICVHTEPFMTPEFAAEVVFGGQLFNQFVRIATPFFFLTTGYFFAVSLSRGASPLKLAAVQIRRLAIFAAFWYSVYLLLPIHRLLKAPEGGYGSAVTHELRRVLSHPVLTLFHGTEIQLWFLPPLACAVALLGLACRFRLERPLAIVTVLL